MKSLKDVIEKSVKQYASEVFIIDRDVYSRKQYTYQDIYDRAISICGYFESMGIKKGDKVVCYLPNSSHYVSVLFACSLSGVVFVPIDFNSNTTFVKDIYDKVSAKLLFCSVFKKSRVSKMFFVEEMNVIYDNFRSFKIHHRVHANDVFEIVYTSGTTSDPKGVVITHNNLVSNINSVRKFISFDKQHILMSLLPLSHLFEQNIGLFVPVCEGYTIVYSFSRKSTSIMKVLEDEHISIIVTVPLFLESIKHKLETKLEHSWSLFRPLILARARRMFRRLEFIFVGGSALDPVVETFWRNLHVTIMQGYGLTECSPLLTGNNRGSEKMGSVGKKVDGVDIKIKDNEVLVKGDNVFLGYYNNVRESKKVLRNGWFYTGDLGKLDEDGYLYLVGRKKNMIVSSSGLNVYPEDIERIVNRQRGVVESVVFLDESTNELVCVVCSSKKLSYDTLLKQVNSNLSSHQYLSKIYPFSKKEFPKTPTKKIIRRKVIEAMKDSIEKKHTSSTSHDEVKNLISEVCNVSLSKIHETTRLAFLGLDSIKRIELAMRIEEAFDLEFDEDSIIEKTTVKDLKSLIVEHKSNTTHSGITVLNSRFFNFFRKFLQVIPIFYSRLFYRVDVKGLENLPQENGFIIIANHSSHFDSTTLLRILPSRVRLNTRIAGAKDYFFQWFLFPLSSVLRLIFNVFAFSRDKHIKQSLIDFSQSINDGWNILIYPEGSRSWDGTLQSFKGGIGLLSWNLETPIVPIKMIGLHDILPKGSFIPRFGNVKVIIGKPLIFNKMTSPLMITKSLQKALSQL